MLRIKKRIRELSQWSYPADAAAQARGERRIYWANRCALLRRYWYGR